MQGEATEGDWDVDVAVLCHMQWHWLATSHTHSNIYKYVNNG